MTNFAEEESCCREIISAYWNGVREGLSRYAWWKDGVQYVGSCGRTLKQSFDITHMEERQALEKLLGESSAR